MTNPQCLDDGRRLLVRERGINGLDYVEVDADRVTLTLFFFGDAPEEMALGNVTLTGGRRIDPQVTDLRLCSADDPERGNCVVLTVDQPGDGSVYTLSVSGLEGFDPRYSSTEFSFDLDCPSELDCAPAPEGVARPQSEPDLDYLAKDYPSFRQLLLDRFALHLPAWQERHVPDLGITLVELLAYAADSLSYYQDAVATEAYLNTARQRISVRRHLRLIDYKLGEGCNARVWMEVQVDTDAVLDGGDLTFATGKPLLGPPVSRMDDLLGAGDGVYEYFEPVQRGPVALHQAHNRIALHTWGNTSCSLARGATSATLLDHWLESGEAEDATPLRALRHLRPGMFLLFEEIVDPETGSAFDADPTHRHVVRLTRMERGEDTLLGVPFVTAEWADADALPFDLVYAALVPPTREGSRGRHADADKCVPMAVSVARGNLLMADHGRTISGEALPAVPSPVRESASCRDGRLTTRSRSAPPWRPALRRGPVTWRSPMPAGRSAAEMLLQNGSTAMPAISLAQAGGRGWTARGDLLASSGDDADFVAEMDESGAAHLRFGDGVNGKLPAAGEILLATYRVGNGTSGNVGAGAIGTVAYRGQARLELGIRAVRNPLAASGGVDPEPVSTACLAGPYALTSELERAVTASDYATLAERDARVQRAAATMRWTGHRALVRVAIDSFGSEDPSAKLLAEIASALAPYRRIGHDVEVVPATYVPLDLELTVCVRPEWLRGQVELALLDLFSSGVRRDGSPGLFHPDRLTFGTSIRGSHLISAAMAVDGVATVKITRLARMFPSPVAEEQQGLSQIQPLEIPQLDNAGTVETGLLTLTMVGGR